MTDQEFQSRMAQAENMYGSSGRPTYYEGYMKGLRRLYQGPRSTSLQEHEKWLGLSYERDESKADRGRGYQHGLQGIEPLHL
jgi:hypothetical protein